MVCFAHCQALRNKRLSNLTCMSEQLPPACGFRLEACPACGSQRERFHGERGTRPSSALGRRSSSVTTGTKLTLYCCLDCDVVYSNPQPRDQVYEKYVDQEYDVAAYFEVIESRKRVLFERRLDAIGPPAPGRNRMIDVGCADGQFIKLAAERGWQPFGIEMNPSAVAKAREGGAVVWQGTLEEVDDIEWGSFDVVCSWDSIEHTPTPIDFAKRFANLIATGGSGEITTLNRKSLVARMRGMRWSMVVDDHFTYWSGRSLERILESNGLQVSGTHYFGLGRDLVAFLDGARASRPAGEIVDLGDAPAPTWDTKSSVLSAEGIVNRLLDSSRLGVGVWVSVSRPAD